jgi:hypothetical protein
MAVARRAIRRLSGTVARGPFLRSPRAQLAFGDRLDIDRELFGDVGSVPFGVGCATSLLPTATLIRIIRP